ncbi:MAG: aminotransferase class V-fold PLP-dependent enzyme [Candidatus Aenigmatarchaeota archaeon]
MLDIKKIRRDFPILKKGIIYFDNACVTLKPIQVIEAMNRYYYEFPACGGRSSHKLGKKVTEEIENSRKIIQKFLNSKKENEIIFTKNTTESINLIANSLNLKKDDMVLTTDKEHNSNLIPWQILSKNGIKHKIIRSNEDNTFDIENFQNMMNRNIKLVSMVHTSNLDGYTIPAKEVIKIAHDFGALVMLDAAQSVPHKIIDVKKLDVDFLAFSGHKMLGPSGTGILYGKYHLLEELKPFLVGGDTVISTTYESFNLEKPPQKFEAGLQNYAGIIGLGEAVKYLIKIGMKNIENHEHELNSKVTEALNIPEVSIIGPSDPLLRSGIISFNVKNTDSHEIAMMLDETANIMVRSGEHCVHSWFNAHNIKGSIRVSLYLYNTKKEVEIFIESLNKIINLLG